MSDPVLGLHLPRSRLRLTPIYLSALHVWFTKYVALLRTCVEKGETTGALDREEMETRHRPSLARLCWARPNLKILGASHSQQSTRERERDREMCIYIYLCTENDTTRLRVGLARVGDQTLHAHTYTHTHTHTHKDSASSEVELPLGARRLPTDRGSPEPAEKQRRGSYNGGGGNPNQTWPPWLRPSTTLLPTTKKKKKKKKK